MTGRTTAVTWTPCCNQPHVGFQMVWLTLHYGSLRAMYRVSTVRNATEADVIAAVERELKRIAADETS